MQCAFQRDSTFPRDAMIINPHFKDTAIAPGGGDPQGLADDLAAALNGWDNQIGQITVKAYDAESAPPNVPVAEAVVNQGAAPATTVPRELAVCLSFYAGLNRARRRGRLYIPAAIASIGVSSARVASSGRDKVAALVPIFAGLGGLDVDWVVWSRVEQTARTVTNWWVDDAWDIQRSRGLQATARLEGTTSG